MTPRLDDGALVALDDVSLPWSTTTIPESSPDVEIVRLHVDPVTRASVSLVRFPAGFSRPAVGHYPCAEEFTVISGSLELNGVVHVAGSSARVPTRATRRTMSSPGATVLAWFSGPARWTPGPAPAGAVDEQPRVGSDEDVDEHDRDLLWLGDRPAWQWLARGERAGRAGPRTGWRWPD